MPKEPMSPLVLARKRTARSWHKLQSLAEDVSTESGKETGLIWSVVVPAVDRLNHSEKPSRTEIYAGMKAHGVDIDDYRSTAYDAPGRPPLSKVEELVRERIAYMSLLGEVRALENESRIAHMSESDIHSLTRSESGKVGLPSAGEIGDLYKHMRRYRYKIRDLKARIDAGEDPEDIDYDRGRKPRTISQQIADFEQVVSETLAKITEKEVALDIPDLHEVYKVQLSGVAQRLRKKITAAKKKDKAELEERLKSVIHARDDSFARAVYIKDEIMRRLGESRFQSLMPLWVRLDAFVKNDSGATTVSRREIEDGYKKAVAMTAQQQREFENVAGPSLASMYESRERDEIKKARTIVQAEMMAAQLRTEKLDLIKKLKK